MTCKVTSDDPYIHSVCLPQRYSTRNIQIYKYACNRRNVQVNIMPQIQYIKTKQYCNKQTNTNTGKYISTLDVRYNYIIYTFTPTHQVQHPFQTIHMLYNMDMINRQTAIVTALTQKEHFFIKNKRYN